VAVLWDGHFFVPKAQKHFPIPSSFSFQRL
jgi:hypothetical protein